MDRDLGIPEYYPITDNAVEKTRKQKSESVDVLQCSNQLVVELERSSMLTSFDLRRLRSMPNIFHQQQLDFAKELVILKNGNSWYPENSFL